MAQLKPNQPHLSAVNFRPQPATPESYEAEERLLGILLCFPEMLGVVAAILPSADAFYLSKHQTIYQVMLNYQQRKIQPDLIVVISTLRSLKKLDRVGENYLYDLCNNTVSNVATIDYANLVADKWLRRRLIQAAHEIMQLADAPDSIDSILEQCESKIYALSNSTLQNQHSRAETVQEIIPRNYSIFEGKIPPAIPTGLLDIDALISGFFAGDLMVIAGRPGMAKTHLAVYLATQLAKKQVPTHIFSLEMTKEQVVNRLVSCLSGINSNHLRQGKLSDPDWEIVAQVMGVLDLFPLSISDDRRLTPTKMRSILRTLPQVPQVVFLDYLQLMGSGSDNRVNELDVITRECRNIAQEFDTCFVTLAQISRGVEQRQNKRPLMSDIRESGGIETHADVIATLYRDDYYNPQSPERGIVEVNIAKSRNGATGVAKLLVDLTTTQFFNLARQF